MPNVPIDITNIRDHYELVEDLDSALEAKQKTNISAKMSELNDAQKKFYEAVKFLIQNLITTQRRNIEEADLEFTKALLTNLSNQQLDWLKNALDSKLDELIETVKTNIDVEIDVSKNEINDNFKKDLIRDINTIFNDLKKKINAFKPKIKSNNRRASTSASPTPTAVKKPSFAITRYSREINAKIGSKINFINTTVNRVYRNFTVIESKLSASNRALSMLSGVIFRKPPRHTPIVPTTTTSMSDYILLNTNVRRMFRVLNRAYIRAVQYYDNNIPTHISAATLRANRILASNFTKDLKQVFTTLFVVDFFLFPIRLFKKARESISIIANLFNKWWIKAIFMPLANIVKFRYFIYKSSFSILLLPIKRITSMTLKFGTFLAKKALRLVSFTFNKVVSLLNRLLMPKSIMKSALTFFKTPFGAYLLGFVIGKVYLFGKSIVTGLKEKILLAYELLDKAKDDFVDWFSTTAIGEMFSDLGNSIEASGGILDFLEKKGGIILDIANKIAHIDVFWILEDLYGQLTSGFLGMLGGSFGSILGGFVGAAIPFPGASIIMSLLGGIAGDKIGRYIAHEMTGYFKVAENNDVAFKESLAYANTGNIKSFSRITSGYSADAEVVRAISGSLMEKLAGMKKDDVNRKATTKQLLYISNMEKLRDEAFSTGKFSRYEQTYNANNLDEDETFEDKIASMKNNLDAEIRITSNQLNDTLKTSDVNKIINETTLQYDFFNKKFKSDVKDVHPYRFRFLRAMYIRSLLSAFKNNSITVDEFINIYNDLSNPKSNRYSKALYNDKSIEQYNSAGKSAEARSHGFEFEPMDPIVTGHRFFEYMPPEKNNNKIIPRYAALEDESVSITQKRFFVTSELSEMLSRLEKQNNAINDENNRYHKLTETISEIRRNVNFDAKINELQKLGASDAIIEEAKKRLHRYIFYLIDNSMATTRADRINEVTEMFNETWPYHLATMLNSGEFGKAESRTTISKLLEKLSEQYEVPEDLKEAFNSGTLNVETMVFNKPLEKPNENGGTTSTIDALERTFAEINDSIEKANKKYDYYTDPKHKAELNEKVDEIKKRLSSWYDRRVYPLVFGGNWNIDDTFNPATLDSN